MAGHGITPYLIFLISVATLSPLLYGYHIAELNAPENAMKCPKDAAPRGLGGDRSINEPPPGSEQEAPKLLALFKAPNCFHMSDNTFALISSIFMVGGLVGSLVGGPMSSKFGRARTMRAIAFIYIVGAFLKALSPNIYVMIVGRFFSGLGAGVALVVVPLYISEISPPQKRGLLGYMTQVSINVGILFTQTLGYFYGSRDTWRRILVAGGCVAVAQLCLLFWVEESPSWMAARGNTILAKRRLQVIRGKGTDITEEVRSWDQDGEGVSEEDRLLPQPEEAQTAAIDRKQEPKRLGISQLVRKPFYRRALLAALGVMTAQQLCGINSIIMYSVSLFADVFHDPRTKTINSAFLSIFISLTNLVATIACSPLPDLLGRKRCLLLSIFGQGMSSLALAFSIVFKVKILSAVAVLFFVGFFAVGLGPAPFILASELVGQEAVDATQSLAVSTNWIAAFLIAQLFPFLNNGMNNHFGGPVYDKDGNRRDRQEGWIYFLFAAFAGISLAFVARRVPETKGKNPDEVWGRTRRSD